MHIAILTWGISTEWEVALRSGANMKDWVEIAGHTCESFDLPLEIDTFLSKYKIFDFVIPVFHGRYGEDGIITGMCETLGIRVAWCPSGVHALCMDKFHTNCVVEKLWVKIPKSWMPGLPLPPKLLPGNEKKETENLDITLIIKPNQWGSSLGATKAKTLKQFELGIASVETTIKSLTEERIWLLTSIWWDEKYQRYFPSLHDLPLVQECIEGREFTVWVYRDRDGTHVLPIIEIVAKTDFFDYQEKYESDGSNEVFTELPDNLRTALEKQTRNIYDFLGCRGVVRMDYRYDGTDLYFLEVNTIPGFTNASLVPKMWRKAGKNEKDFVEMLFF